MNLAKVEKFSLQTIADFLNRSDLFAARSVLSFAVGSVLDVTGKIQKVVKRDGKLKLVIEPDGINSFVIFADCLCVAENLRKPQIRKVQRWRSGGNCSHSADSRFVYLIASSRRKVKTNRN